MVHGIGMHVMHHIIMCSSSCSSLIMLINDDHHDVHRSLFNQQSMNNNHCSLILIVCWLCDREQCESGWVDGVRPFSCVLLWNGGGVCCCWPALSSGTARAPPIPVQYSSVLRSCHATVSRRVCGVCGVYVCLCCSCGGVSSDHSPLVVVVGGGVVDGGAARWDGVAW